MQMSTASKLDEVCDSFEREWIAGRSPRLEDRLRDTGDADRAMLVEELLAIELEYRRRRGDSPAAEEFVRRLPEFAEQVSQFFRDRADELAGPVPELPYVPACRTDIPVRQNGAWIQANESDKDVRPTKSTVRSSVPLGRFGEYELLEVIARGGMGVVYKARQLKPNRIVALKMIRSGELATEEEVRRFYAEAEAAAKLDHPGIVPIFEVGQCEGQHFYSMGYVEGTSLAEAVRAGPLPERRAAEIMKLVAEAVEYAHQHGIVHRDLKPENVLLALECGGLTPLSFGQAENTANATSLSSDDKRQPESKAASSRRTPKFTPKITDFGLAKNVLTDSSLTASGAVLGTPSYMPPEQAAGQVKLIGPRSDVYSLGAVLYRLVAGRPPFLAPTPVETMRQVIDQEPLSLRHFNLRIDRDLQTICMTCLQKEPQRRYASAQALADDLGRYLNGEPILARRVGSAERLWRWCRRNPLVAGLTGLVAASLVVGTVVASYFAVEARARAREARDRELDAEDHLFATQMNLAQSHWRAAEVPQVLELLQLYIPDQSTRPDRRGFAWNYLWRLCHSELQTLHPDSYVRAVAFSPDGRRFATAGSNAKVHVRDTITFQPVFSLDCSGSVQSVAFSPDGKLLAAAGWTNDQPGEVQLWDASTGRPLRTLEGHTDRVSSIAFSPDGQRLASGSRDRTVRIWDVTSGRIEQSFATDPVKVSGVAFSPDGRRVAACGSEAYPEPGHLFVWDLATRRVVMSELKSTLPFLAVSFDPRGRRVAAATSDGVIHVWDVNSGATLFALKGHSNAATSVAFSPDGRRLVSSSWDQTVRLWDATNPGAPGLLVLDCGFIAHGVAFSPDGNFVACGLNGGQVKLWDARPHTDALRAERDAVGMFGFLFGKGMLKGEVLDHVRSDQTIGEAVREAALALADRYQEHPQALNNASWNVVRSAGQTPEAYAQALRKAERACEFFPNDGSFLNTLGVAQYRVGQYEEAARTLSRSGQLNTDPLGTPNPADLAFLAMAQILLGLNEPARANIASLRELMQQPRWGDDAECRGFVLELEAVAAVKNVRELDAQRDE